MCMRIIVAVKMFTRVLIDCVGGKGEIVECVETPMIVLSVYRSGDN